VAYFGQPHPARLFFDTSYLDVIVPGILRVPIEVIVIHFGLKGLMTVKIAACYITGSSPYSQSPEKSTF
jgi:hypothetical protein